MSSVHPKVMWPVVKGEMMGRKLEKNGLPRSPLDVLDLIELIEKFGGYWTLDCEKCEAANSEIKSTIRRPTTNIEEHCGCGGEIINRKWNTEIHPH